MKIFKIELSYKLNFIEDILMISSDIKNFIVRNKIMMLKIFNKY